jgi:hypothetical protein
MMQVAAHLTDHVLPPLPVRQWVLSLPKRIRPFLPHDPRLAGAVLRVLLRAIRTTLRRASPSAPADAQLGAVSFLHRFGSALNPHSHTATTASAKSSTCPRVPPATAAPASPSLPSSFSPHSAAPHPRSPQFTGPAPSSRRRAGTGLDRDLYLNKARPRLARGRDPGHLFLTSRGRRFHTNRLSELVRGYIAAADLGKSGAATSFGIPPRR